MKQVGDFKTIKEMIQDFLNKDCLGNCSSCFYGQNTVWINSKSAVTLCNIMQKCIVKGIRETEKEYEECTK